jgi:4-amino-4-deoxy-L-arabinose transferase-like glycosyltransferase
MLLLRLGATPVYILDEVKNAECAREMLQRGDFITPTFNGEIRPDKPPLHYFFMMASYKLWGITPFAARFFSAIMGLLTLLVTYLYTKKLFAPFIAFCAAAVLLASPHFLFEFRLAVPDPYLVFFLTLGLFSGLFSGFTWLQQNNTGQLFISAAALALATLAKGPVALVLPGVSLLTWALVAKKWKVFFTWRLLAALLLAGVIALPWYLAVNDATNGVWTRGFFIEHNLNRFSNPQEGHGGIFIITPLFVVIGLLPFTGFIGEVFKQRRYVFKNALAKFSGIVVLVFVVFFSVSSTRLPNYPMPCYPFAAIILGNFIAALLNGNVPSAKYPFFIALAFSGLVAVGGFFAIDSEKELAFLRWMPLLLLVCPALMLIIYYAQQKKWPALIKGIAVGYFLFSIIGLNYIYPALYKQNPVAKTIDTIKQYKYVVGYTLFNPAYRFYIDSDIVHTGSAAELQNMINRHKNIVIITRESYTDSLKNMPIKEITRHRDIFELPTTVIYRKIDE